MSLQLSLHPARPYSFGIRDSSPRLRRVGRGPPEETGETVPSHRRGIGPRSVCAFLSPFYQESNKRKLTNFLPMLWPSRLQPRVERVSFIF